MIKLILAVILGSIGGVWFSWLVLYLTFVLPYQLFLKVFYNRSLLRSVRAHLRDPWEED